MKFTALAPTIAILVLGVAPAAYAFNYNFLSKTVLAKLTPEDVKIGTAATVRALDAAVDGEWSNPNTGASGKILIVKTLDVDGHKDCRQTRLDVQAGDSKGHGTYILCKRPSGKWAFYSAAK